MRVLPCPSVFRLLQQPHPIHRGARPPPLPIWPGVRGQRASPILDPHIEQARIQPDGL